MMKMFVDMNKDVVLMSVVIAESVIIVLQFIYIWRRSLKREDRTEEKGPQNIPSQKVAIFDKILQFWSGLFRQHPVFQVLTMKDIAAIVQQMPAAYKAVEAGSKRLYFVRVSAERIPESVIPSTELKNHDSVGLFVVTDLNGTPQQVCHVIFWEKMSEELEEFMKEGNDALELCV